LSPAWQITTTVMLFALACLAGDCEGAATFGALEQP
jgi:hypothetical protein